MKRRGFLLLLLLLLEAFRLTIPFLALSRRTSSSADFTRSSFPCSGTSSRETDTHLCNIRLYASAADENADPLAPKLDFNECFYSVLETTPTASSAVLKKAYYQMVFKYHPDNIKDEDPKGALKRLRNQQMMVINAAYKVLRDVQLRQIYDQERRSGRVGAQAKMPKAGKGGVEEKRSAPSSSDKTSNSDAEVDEMGWRRKSTNNDNRPYDDQRRYSEDASKSKDWEVDEMGWQVKKPRQSDNKQEQLYENDDKDLEEMLRQGWFDEEFKTRLLRRRLERQSAESGVETDALRPMSVFEEIKEILREEDRTQTERRRGSSGEESYRYRTQPKSSRDDSQRAAEKINQNPTIVALKAELQRRETLLACDDRDWGEVKDAQLIERRLRDLSAVKELRARIAELESDAFQDNYSSTFGGGRRNDGYWKVADSDEYEYEQEAFKQETLWRRAYERSRRSTGGGDEQGRNRNDRFSGDDYVADEIRRLRDI